MSFRGQGPAEAGDGPARAGDGPAKAGPYREGGRGLRHAARQNCLWFFTAVIVLAAAGALEYGTRGAVAAGKPLPPVVSVREQARIVDGSLRDRFDTILPELMRREQFDMWIVDAREYAEDPVVRTMIPATWLNARRRTILVFFDRGGTGIERLAIARYPVGTFFRAAWNPDEVPDQWQRLAQIVAERDPKRIAIDESRDYAHADGLTATERRALESALGPKYASRLAPAERLVVGWLERRTPAELARYREICAIAHGIIAEAFSSQVITPGATSTDDVVWWMRQRITDLGLSTWFHPSVEIQRAGAKEEEIAKDPIIRPGDLLHCDFGITYLRLNTDTQQHAYVLKPGETDAPDGLKQALKNGNRLQDILTGTFRVGRTGNEILRLSLAQARAEGLKPSIYTHPIGFHGHAAGPTIGMWDMQNGVPGTGDYPMYADTCYSIELNNRTNVREWNGQDVRIALEEDAMFTARGVEWIDSRQTALFLIPSAGTSSK